MRVLAALGFCLTALLIDITTEPTGSVGGRVLAAAGAAVVAALSVWFTVLAVQKRPRR